MASGFNRRELLRAGVGTAVGLALYGCAAVETRRSSPRQAASIALGDRLMLVAGTGGNVIALRGEEGLLLVDSGAPDGTSALQDALQAFAPGVAVHTVINTHWHALQSGGNEAFAAGGARLISHAKAAQRMAVPQYVPSEDRYLPARAKEAVPKDVFYIGKKELTFGGEQIEYGYLQQPHTDGDLYVWLKNANVLVVGDAVAPVTDPQICWYEGGWVGGRIDSQAKLLALGNEQTRIIAATGGVISRAEVKTENDALMQMFERVSDAMRKGFTTEDMQQGKLLDGLPRTWSDPDKALYDAHKSMWAHYNKLSHSIV